MAVFCALTTMKTRDGRFAYEAAGDPRLAAAGVPAWHWRRGAGVARPARILRRSLSRDRLGHAGLWRLGAAADRQHRNPGRRLAGFPAAGRRDQAHSGRAFDRRHDRSAMAGEQSPTSPSAVVLAQTSPAFGKPDGDWQKAFIDARLGPLDRGETHGLAGAVAGAGTGRRRSRSGRHGACARLHGRVPEATYRATHAGPDGVRPAQRAWDRSQCRRWCCRAPRTTMRRRR